MTLSWWLGEIFSNGGLFILLMFIPLLWLEREKRLTIKTVVVLFAAFLVTEAIKRIFPVERPFVDLNVTVPFSFVKLNDSFPSGHTAMAFAIATSVWLAKHRLGIVALFIALIVGIGRVLLLVHFPIDVIGGGSIGAVIALLLSEVFKTRKRRLRGGEDRLK